MLDILYVIWYNEVKLKERIEVSMKHCFTKTLDIACCGYLDKNVDDEYVIIVEGKDKTEEYLVSDLLRQMYGSEVCLKSASAEV